GTNTTATSSTSASRSSSEIGGRQDVLGLPELIVRLEVWSPAALHSISEFGARSARNPMLHHQSHELISRRSAPSRRARAVTVERQLNADRRTGRGAPRLSHETVPSGVDNRGQEWTLVDRVGQDHELIPLQALSSLAGGPKSCTTGRYVL